MSGPLFSVMAAFLSALTNFFFRKSSESNPSKSYNYYLLFFYGTSFLISLFFSPIKELDQLNPVMFGIGCVVGSLTMLMMWFTSKALLSGPAGMTFAFQNASGIFPGLILFSLFGQLYGFEVSLLQLIGMVLVVLGLFLGSVGDQKNSLTIKWLSYALGCFFVQICALTMIHWRCLLFTKDVPNHQLIPWSLSEYCDGWFLPGQFGAAFILQLLLIIFHERRYCFRSEFSYGLLGGATNIFSAICILIATKIALPFEKGLIFPCFTASTVILCNIWAYWLYHEKFNYLSNFCCAGGILLGSL